jgi:hypothetical protein
MRLAALGILLLLAWPGAAQAEERLLVQEQQYLVVTDQAAKCGDPVAITIRAADEQIFAPASERLQRIVDGVRAMLSFECARIPRLDVVGEVGPESRPVYRGVAGDTTGWLIETRESTVAAAPGGTAGAPVSRQVLPPPPPPPAAPQREIAGVRLGMTIDEALQAASESFESEPVFDSRRRMMQAAQGGCDFRFGAGHGPEPGWRCLEAAFTSGQPGLLKALGLTQVLDQDQRDAIEDLLVERFGQPSERFREEGAARNGGYPYLFLAWEDALSTDRAGRLDFVPAPLHKLEAYAIARDGVTVVTIWHQDPAIEAAAAPKHRLKL